MSSQGEWFGVLQRDECCFQFIERTVREFFEVHGCELGFGIMVYEWVEEIKFEFEDKTAFESFDGRDMCCKVGRFGRDGKFGSFSILSFEFFDGFELCWSGICHGSFFRSLSGSKSELTSVWFTHTCKRECITEILFLCCMGVNRSIICVSVVSISRICSRFEVSGCLAISVICRAISR